MSKKRKHYASAFKAKVALAAIRSDETMPQLAARHGLHPTQINAWKRQLIEQAEEVFARGNGAKKGPEHGVDDLHRVIGQLTVERDFLARKLDH
jgi:transposase